MAEWGANAPRGCGQEIKESQQTSPHSPVLAPSVPKAVSLGLSPVPSSSAVSSSPGGPARPFI